MSFKATSTNSKAQQQVVPVGTHEARLVQVITLGLQPQRPYKGEEKKPCYELMVTYELCDNFMVDEEGNILEDKPRWVSETFPHYPRSADRSKASKRMVALDPDNLYDGDWSQMIGTACSVTIVHNQGKGIHAGKTYANIGQVSNIPAKFANMVPELINEPVLFDTEEPDMGIWEKLPDWIKDKIKNNLEFKGSKLESLIGSPSEVSSEDPEVSPVNKDDNPY
jgi:hypothetical protein